MISMFMTLFRPNETWVSFLCDGIIKADANEEIFRGRGLIYWFQRTGTAWRSLKSFQSASQTSANFPLEWRRRISMKLRNHWKLMKMPLPPNWHKKNVAGELKKPISNLLKYWLSHYLQFISTRSGLHIDRWLKRKISLMSKKLETGAGENLMVMSTLRVIHI